MTTFISFCFIYVQIIWNFLLKAPAEIVNDEDIYYIPGTVEEKVGLFLQYFSFNFLNRILTPNPCLLMF